MAKYLVILQTGLLSGFVTSAELEIECTIDDLPKKIREKKEALEAELLKSFSYSEFYINVQQVLPL